MIIEWCLLDWGTDSQLSFLKDRILLFKDQI